MSLWSWLRARLTNDTPRMRTRDGRHQLRWQGAFPLVVFVEDSAVAWLPHIVEALREVNAVAFAALVPPLEPMAEITRGFAGAPDDPLVRWPRGSLYIRVRPAEDGDDNPHTEHEHDAKGLVNAARITLRPHALTPPWKRPIIVRHELGHVLTLGHAKRPDSVMWASIRSQEQCWLDVDRRPMRKAVQG